MQQAGLKLGDISFSLSGWDSNMMNKILTDNDQPLCHSEIEAFVEFLSGVAKDGNTNSITRKDRANAWQLYGNDVSPGKLFIHPEDLTLNLYRNFNSSRSSVK